MLGIADREVDAANRRPLPRLDDRSANAGGGQIDFDLGRLQAIKLLLLRARLARRVGVRPILVDEALQLLLLRLDGRIHAQIVLDAFLLEFEKGIDLAGIHRQLAARDVERVRTRRFQKRPVVRHDQARFFEPAQKVFEQNLRSQVEEVGWLVEQ
jgi:hypothetical protein